MKKLFIYYLVLSLIYLLVVFVKTSDIAIYQLTNQSDRQMMSYIIECEGNTIVIDGGTEDDERYLIKKVKEISGDGKVEAWFLTHYHDDHTGALAKYLKSNDQSIEIDTIYYNFPKKKWVKKYEPTRYQDIVNIDKGLKKFKNKKVVYLDERIKLDDVTVEVLRTYNSLITNNAGNNSSSVYKFNIFGTKLLFLGDLGDEGSNELLRLNYSSIENMDYVQMAHHGQRGGNYRLYKTIHPKYCLWPSTDGIWKNESGLYETDKTKKWINALHVKRNYVSNKRDICIKFKINRWRIYA